MCNYGNICKGIDSTPDTLQWYEGNEKSRNATLRATNMKCICRITVFYTYVVSNSLNPYRVIWCVVFLDFWSVGAGTDSLIPIHSKLHSSRSPVTFSFIQVRKVHLEVVKKPFSFDSSLLLSWFSQPTSSWQFVWNSVVIYYFPALFVRCDVVRMLKCVSITQHMHVSRGMCVRCRKQTHTWIYLVQNIPSGLRKTLTKGLVLKIIFSVSNLLFGKAIEWHMMVWGWMGRQFGQLFCTKSYPLFSR